jgi:phosphonate transport system ATP-binding protein
VLEIAETSVTYRNGVCALDGASLTFEPGRFVVLLGPSGAGKSTLLRCLNGLVRPTRGDVRADEQSIFASRTALRRHRQQTAMIFQQHHLIGRLTALQNVLIGRLGFQPSLRSLLPHSRAERRLALEALDRVGLVDRALSRADQLSGGQQQRVGIARVLVQNPHTILADEPVASLDPATAAHVLELIHSICREDGITAIVSLHQVDLARRFADRMIGLAGGRIVFDGATAELTAAELQLIYAAAAPGAADAEASLSPRQRQQPSPPSTHQPKEHRHESPSSAIAHRRSDDRIERHVRAGAG